MDERKWGIGMVIVISFSCLICSAGTTYWMRNYFYQGDVRLLFISLWLILLSGFAGLATGIFVGRNIVIRTKPTSVVRAILYIFYSGLFTAIFIGTTILIANVMGLFN